MSDALMAKLLLSALLSSSKDCPGSSSSRSGGSAGALVRLLAAGPTSSSQSPKERKAESPRELQNAHEERSDGVEKMVIKKPSFLLGRYTEEKIKSRGFDLALLASNSQAILLASICNLSKPLEEIEKVLAQPDSSLATHGWTFSKLGSGHVKHLLIEAMYHTDLRVFEKIVEAAPKEMLNGGLPACNGKLAHPLLWALSRNLTHHADVLVRHGSLLSRATNFNPTAHCHCMSERSVLHHLAKQPGLAIATYAWAVDHLVKTGSLQADLDRPFTTPGFQGYSTYMHLLSRPDDARALALLEIVLRAGGDPNVTKHDSWRPLHLAAGNNYYEAARLLIHHGANPTVLNDERKTPRQVAEANGFGAITWFLADAEVAWERKKRNDTTAAPETSAQPERAESDRPKKRSRR